MTDESAGGTGAVAGTILDPARVLGAPTSGKGTVIGSGRRGVTLRAVHAADGRAVAVKVGWERLERKRDQRRFVDATTALGGLVSPLLARVVASGCGPTGEPWVMTPWVEGGSLADRLRQGPLDVDDAAAVARHSAAGLAALDASGLVHGNLTPGNVLIGRDATVTVEGMSLRHLSPRWAPGTVEAHIPPEVVEGGPWTSQGDVWSWASVMHTLLHGRQPWATAAQRGPAAFLLAMTNGEPPGLRRPDVTDDLHDLILAALAVDPGHRPAGASSLVAALGPHIPSRATTVSPGRSPGAATDRPLGSNYLLQHPLGAGGSGQVWLARRRWDDSAVAVKVLKPALAADPDQVARFLRERTTLVGLTHPNLVPILDLVAEGETLAIVMDLVDGQDLRRLLTERPTMAPDSICWLLAQIASGVEAMHQAGIVHRDIKPENVLVETSPDGAKRARLTDFGLARALEGPSLTAMTELLGTVDYLAPELVAGQPLSSAVDIYALGVMAYELACGWRPFSGTHPASVLRAHIDRTPVQPPGVPNPLWAIIARCLAKDPDQRPDAAALRVALEAVAPGLAGVAALDRDWWQPPNDPAPVGSPAGDWATATEPVEPDEERNETIRRQHPFPQRDGADIDAPARSPWPLRAAIGAAVVILGAGGGVGWALTHRARPARAIGVDVTSSVTVIGPGSIDVSYAADTDPSLIDYIVVRRPSPGGPFTPINTRPDGSTYHVTGQPSGPACFQVESLLASPPKTKPASKLSSVECVNVP